MFIFERASGDKKQLFVISVFAIYLFVRMSGKKAVNKARYDLAVCNIETIYGLSQSALDSQEQKSLFKTRCGDLEKCYKELQDLYLKLVTDPSEDFDVEKQILNFKELTDKYYKSKTKYTEWFQVQPESGPSKSSVYSEPIKPKHNIMLPSVQIPTFSGKIQEYAHFMDLFEAMVGSDENLSDAHKMYYLYGSLSGEAKMLVQHLSITGENYSVLLDILKSRYGNKRLQADKLLNTLMSLSHVHRNLSSLKNFLNTLLETTKALQKLEFPVDQWSYLLLYINLNKIDVNLKRQFEDKYGGVSVLPTFDNFITFLTKEVQILEVTDTQKTSSSQRVHVSYNNNNSQQKPGGKCVCCNGVHQISKCDKFIRMHPMNRKRLIISHGMCFRCLNKHNIKDCRIRLTCDKCQSVNHNTLLHLEQRSVGAVVESPTSTSAAHSAVVPEETVPEVPSENETDPSTSNSLHAVSANVSRRAVLLSTAMVRVLDRDDTYHRARALIDGGSQSTFVSEEFVKKLGLRTQRSGSVAVKGIGGNALQGCKGDVVLRISPCHADQPVLVTSGLVLNKVADNLPSCSLPNNLAKYYNGLQLADDQFYKSGKIDLLIGADLMSDILLGGDIVRVQGMPCAISTIFGYILQGPVTYSTDSADSCQTFFVNTEMMLEKFWEVEEVPCKMSDPKDDECELHFQNTHQRNEIGRYVLRLPFAKSATELGDSSKQALRRFYSMEKRLQANEKLREKYVEFMREYKDMGHMAPCDGYQGEPRYVIPHHGIFKSGTEKIRVVFDASCATCSGHSLNDCLHAGPKLQHDVMQVICRFRCCNVVFATDIRMMFRMIEIHKDDRRFQLIYWRESPELPLQMYELKTVTYGMKSSPYLAIRTLRQLADDGQQTFPEAAEVLRSSVYMDDILSGAETFEKAQKLKQDLVGLLALGGFELRKWVSNDRRLLEDIPPEHQEKPHVFDTEGPSFVKILGVQWNPVEDNFTYHTNLDSSKECTKRTILSTLARMFDPMGWISPVIFQGKLLMQRLWSLNLGWDERPPPEIISEWESIVSGLPCLEAVKIDRYGLSDDIAHCSLHGFSDASDNGYGAAVYIRSVDKGGKIKISLMMAKSKVAPIKSKLTIPKMELSGAALVVKVLKYVLDAIQDKVLVQDVFGWSDSTIVLCWLKQSPHVLQPFEGNRVAQIANCGLDITWRYVPSEMNPADVASRGCRARDLPSHSLWWGPEWLFSKEEMWPVNIVGNVENLPGLRKNIVVAAAHSAEMSTDQSIFERFSSLTTLISVVAYCFRFAHNAKSPSNKSTGPLSVKERRSALDRLIVLAQAEVFSRDIEMLQRGKRCSTKLRRLKPFLDTSTGLVRVGGRLEHSGLSFSAKHPVILGKSHILTTLIITHYHRLYCHIGATGLQAILQKEFWIISARQIIRSLIFKCVHCFRTKAKPAEPMMADLPADRTNATGVFHTVQTDFGGPFTIKASRLRNAKTFKAYLCVFICSASKALHLEVVGDLSTEGFLAAFSRFASRRGLPRFVRSDNGTNYVGSNRYLSDVQKFLASRSVQSELSDKVAQQGVTWQFNPPTASHFGGLFEAAVKSAKTLLKRVIGEQVLTYEELTTVFTRIEAVLNSRPLCPLSHDPQEFEVLTPAHFLIGRPLLSVPEYKWDDIPDSRLNRYQLLHAMTQRFWHKWSEQYLHTLQMRNKWISTTDPPKLGDLVLIKEENVPPLKWNMARIIELLPGRDKVVRVVRLKTASSELVRPVVKICRLPSN